MDKVKSGGNRSTLKNEMVQLANIFILFQQILGNVVDSIRSVFPILKSAAEVSNAVSLTAAEKSRMVAS